ncbi:MAG: magnesium chelatase ATPase subunit I, partial [Deltaproteobacteria bacterium]
MKNENLIYPFTAIVGQEKMKNSLILNAINPKLGGVL